jgi:hypothetical protein
MSDRSILNPQYSNSLNALFSGTGNVDLGTVVANKVTIDSANNDNDYSLTCFSNALVITCPVAATPNVQIGNANQYVQLKCPATGVLKVPQLEVNSGDGNAVTLSAIATDYLSLNGGNIQGANLNATEGIACAGPLNMSDTQGNMNIQFTYPYLTIGSPLSVTGYINAPYFSGGMYSDVITYNPPRSVPASIGTSAIIALIPWNPTANWTVDTVTAVQNYVSDYPLTTTSIGLVKVGTNQLQITFNTQNTNAQPSNLYSASFIIVNQYT